MHRNESHEREEDRKSRSMECEERQPESVVTLCKYAEPPQERKKWKYQQGKETIEKLKIARMVCSVNGVRSYFEKYPDIFQGIGCLPGQYSIKINPSVKSCVHAARRFLEGILVKLKSKLESLEKRNIIVKELEPTEWVIHS